MFCLLVQSDGLGDGGVDPTPNAVNWANITNASGVRGYGFNAAQTIAGTDKNLQLKAVWTSASSSPAKGVWVKNGTSVEDPHLSPAYVNVRTGDSVYFWMEDYYTYPSGNYDTGTVTVTNETDAGVVLDTFTFQLYYTPGPVPPGSGSNDQPP